MTAKADVRADFFESLWRFFASLRLTLVLLLTLAAASIAGTLVPQNADPSEYFRHFGPFWYRLLAVLDMFDMYHAWWFQMLILALAVNLVVCSVDRLGVVWKIVFPKQLRLDPERLLAAKHKERFSVGKPADTLAEPLQRWLRRRYRTVVVADGNGQVAMAAERGRWTRLGVYVVHLSVLVLLVGAMVGSLFGFDGFVAIPEGQSADRIQLNATGRSLALPFAIRCDDFDVQFYDTGAPKEFRSKLTLLRDGKALVQKDIIVNDPLRFEGINIFQASYGKLDSQQQGALQGPEDGPQTVQLEVTSVASSMTYPVTAAMGRPVDLPEALGTLTLTGYLRQARFGGQAIGPALEAELKGPDGKVQKLMLPFGFPQFDRMRRGQAVIAVAEATRNQVLGKAAESQARYYTGLQVTRDPGVPLVYLGFVLMLAGCVICFFMAHEQLAVQLVPEKDKTTIVVCGKANKNRLGYRRKVAGLAAALAAELGGTQGEPRQN